MTSNRKQKADKKRNTNSGSAIYSEPEFLLIGYLGRPHGINGEILMYLQTDFPERIEKGETYFVGDNHQPHILKNTRHHNKGLIIKFSEYQHRDQVDVIKNSGVFVKTDSLPPLEDGKYYLHQILGLDVKTEDGAEIGKLESHIETGANFVYLIRSHDGKERFIPAIDDVILSVDLETKVMTVRLLDGLEETWK
jgi:16S rRNA processing protein RimM